MATTVTSVIDVAGGGGVDYTSLAAWQTAKAADIVAADQIQQAQCQGTGADTAALTMTGWTTDATRYVRIFGASKNGTTYSTSKFRMERTNLSVIDIRTPAFCRIEDIQIQITNNTSGSGNNAIFNNFAAYTTTDIRVTGCIIACVASGTSSEGAAFLLGVGGSNVYKIMNNFMYGWHRTGATGFAGIYMQEGTWYIYNNTGRNNYNGVTWGSGVDVTYLRNNMFTEPGNVCYTSTSGTITSSANISSETSSPDASFRSKTITYTGTDDCSHDDADAKDVGTSLASDPDTSGLGVLTSDIAGTTRPQGSGYDTGAYEVLSATGKRILIAGIKKNPLRAGVKNRIIAGGL